MPDTITFVSLGTPDEDEADALQKYASEAPPILIAAGAEPVLKAKFVEQLVGSDAPQTIFVAKFPSADALKKAFDSPEYQALVPVRDRAFRKLDFFLVETF